MNRFRFNGPTEAAMKGSVYYGTNGVTRIEAQANPMTEGHHGSVICLSCTKRALEEAGGSNAGGELYVVAPRGAVGFWVHDAIPGFFRRCGEDC